MQQITTLNHPQKSATSSLRNSITKNFDTLRESLVQCSRMVSQQEGYSVSSTKKKANNLTDLISQTKQEMKNEIEENSSKTRKIAENGFKQIIDVLEKERAAHKKL